MPRVHKISVQQGNLITQEMVDQLKPGMTRGQVAYIMGEPIFRNTFNEQRWDYVYTISVPGYFETDMKMSLFFEDDSLAYFTGDLAPTDPTDVDEVPEDVEEEEEEEPTT
ncbi:MAG: outer membrane protein assembly factor BamE [Pseudomonadales bacterium]|nr:outer membrane protein assembly factor BamE [Pseudomonadales bacterium]